MYDVPFTSTVRIVAVSLLLSLIAHSANAQRAQRDQPTAPSRVPPGKTEYMGRTIAQTMHYTGAPWLLRDSREREERCSRMLANMGIENGMTVCDMGCGNGFYSLKMAKLVGSAGRILAVDIQPQMLVLLRQRMEAEQIDNISPILGSIHDPRLPRASADRILLVDVYHEFSHPARMLAAMHAALKPDGLLVLLEYRGEDASVPIKPLHKMTRAQILKEFNANGFRLEKEFNKLPWQHMMFFAKQAEDKK